MQKQTRRNAISNKIFHGISTTLSGEISHAGQLRNLWQMLAEP